MSAIPRYFFVFDVESIGLHGEGFQVGWVVLDMQDGGRLDEGLVQCLPRIARANAASTGSLSMGDRSWVDTHVKTAVAAIEEFGGFVLGEDFKPPGGGDLGIDDFVFHCV